MRNGFENLGWWFDTSDLTADQTVERILRDAPWRAVVTNSTGGSAAVCSPGSSSSTTTSDRHRSPHPQIHAWIQGFHAWARNPQIHAWIQGFHAWARPCAEPDESHDRR
jgi:hypothetical protein